MATTLPVPQDPSYKFRASATSRRGDPSYEYLFIADNDPNSKDKKVRFMEVYEYNEFRKRIDLREYNIANVYNGQPFGKPVVYGDSIVCVCERVKDDEGTSRSTVDKRDEEVQKMSRGFHLDEENIIETAFGEKLYEIKRPVLLWYRAGVDEVALYEGDGVKAPKFPCYVSLFT